ncbi:alkaline phosphatase [Azospirillum thiophilum]|uniref:Alkaline phosphatase n=1 Tax=Azospirillum thiophilum TaxID=528244 RepID=A0AAC8W693_9PROT|nr:alkaline phosphatase PhoX [Azospirillum thiophilum]ALG75606.1 alkaline phosphatase [Azospirillum thiophilum]KJR62125.1 alkaline phosphatase [Azospirillum thiophilum]
MTNLSANLPETSRRSVLRALAGLPLLPVAGIGAGELLFASGAEAASAKGAPVAVEFVGMAAPTTAAAQAKTVVESSMVVTWADGSKQSFALGYQPLFITGDMVPDGKGGTTLAGGYYDIAGKPILDGSMATPAPFFSDCPDGCNLLNPMPATVPGVTGNTLFAVVQFEYATRDSKDASMYGKLPSPIAVLTLDQNKETGALKLVKYHTVDTSPAHGLWITCGASLSPWNTHLSSEEYEPDATAIDDQFRAFSQNLYGAPDKANPYHYGHMPEVTVNPDGTGRITKHYCMGRISHELVQVMPDDRTVLMGDDATNGGLFMFIADHAKDLSAGTLYAAKMEQEPGKDLDKGGSFALKWVKLGHATSAEVEKLADSLKAADIVEVKKEDPKDPSFTAIGFNGKTQWVKFKPGMEKAAAFLETHRYAPVAGATLALSKLEGVTVNIKDKTAYMAVAYMYKSMSDGKSGIKVDTINAGAVYQLPMKGGQVDLGGATIASDWVPVHFSTVPALVGRDLATPDALGNTADADRVANPDNLKFSEKLRTLFIGEDSGTHVNNFLWAYNVDSKQLARILSCPVGAESTGLQAADDLNGFSYIMSNFQHPGDWEKGLHDKVKDSVAALIDDAYRNRRSGGVGYIHGLPQAV